MRLRRYDTRIIKRFLFFPRTIGNITKWWEWVRIEQEYNPHQKVEGWVDQRFVDKNEHQWHSVNSKGYCIHCHKRIVKKPNFMYEIYENRKTTRNCP